jgi:hypothetical protein
MGSKITALQDEMASEALAMTDEEVIQCHQMEQKIIARLETMARKLGDPITNEEENWLAIVCHMAYHELVILPKRTK